MVRQTKSTKRKVCILSGKRGGFGSLIRTMRLIEEDPTLELQLVVTDMHMDDKFGKTLYEVEKNFHVNAKVDMRQGGSDSLSRSIAMGVCEQEISKVLKRLNPDIFLCLGDRGEVLVSVIAANNLRIPVAHVQGGDISGNLDEVFRHAITKMSHIHFPSTKDSARRIIGMGEERWRVHVVGDTHLDLITAGLYTPNEVVRGKHGLTKDEPYLIVLQHSVNTEPDKSYEQMQTTLRAVARAGMKALVVYPCSDQGYGGIIRAIREHRKNSDVLIHKNIDAPDFLGLMEGARALVGNSSSGIIEAPLFKLPVVNIGKRQAGRLRDSNVIDISGKTSREIEQAIRNAFSNKAFRSKLAQGGKLYGKGNSAEKIVKVLKEVPLDDRLFEKKMTH